MIVPGANGHAPLRQKTAIWKYYNGHVKMAAPGDVETCDFAAGNGHLAILQWARENNCPWDAVTCAKAAENGHLKLLKWARENRCPWNERTCANAAKKVTLKC